MNARKITSLMALISFVLEIITSIILYIVPQGRVAYWTDWHLLGLTKTQWTNLHINLGVLFLLAILFHVYFNWSAITAYLKNRMRKLTIFTPQFNAAFILTFVFCLGTFYEIPPFSTIIAISDSVKVEAAMTYGEPPYGHAELSTLTALTEKVKIDLNASLAKLSEAGLTGIAPEKTLKEIAKSNKTSPQAIFAIIKPEEPKIVTADHGLPVEPPAGFGHLPIAEVCKEYKFSENNILAILANQGFEADNTMSLKEIGTKYNRHPHDLYTLLEQNFNKGL